MWDCEHCGCQNIAGSVTFCPQCFIPRNAEPEPQESTPTGPVESAGGFAESVPDSLPKDDKTT
jgi:hypothetical protein